jgi:hypothetical protein
MQCCAGIAEQRGSCWHRCLSLTVALRACHCKKGCPSPLLMGGEEWGLWLLQ